MVTVLSGDKTGVYCLVTRLELEKQLPGLITEGASRAEFIMYLGFVFFFN